MTLIDFIQEYPDEESCKAKFKQYRDHVGVVCPKCSSAEHYWKRDKECYECKHCRHRQGLRANTVMHKSKLPYRYWFIAMHLFTSTKKSFSSKELQRQLGHNRYHPVWHMAHKLRDAMGKRDDEYVLAGRIELDEGYFSTETPAGEKDRPRYAPFAFTEKGLYMLATILKSPVAIEATFAIIETFAKLRELARTVDRLNDADVPDAEETTLKEKRVKLFKEVFTDPLPLKMRQTKLSFNFGVVKISIETTFERESK